MSTASPAPTPEEIEAACREIRKQWNTSERYKRAQLILSDDQFAKESEQTRRSDK